MKEPAVPVILGHFVKITVLKQKTLKFHETDIILGDFYEFGEKQKIL